MSSKKLYDPYNNGNSDCQSAANIIATATDKLKTAKERLALLQGHPIVFKRPRDLTTSSIELVGNDESEAALNDAKRSRKVVISPYGQCPNVSASYRKLSRLGQGTYGVVYCARDLQTNKLVALKRCLPHHESSDGFPLTTLREIQALRELSSFEDDRGSGKNHIVKLLNVAVSSSQQGVFLVFEYCDSDLANIIDAYFDAHHKSPFTQSQVKRLSMQLLGAIQFLHGRHFLHRDLKMSNLLYCNDSGSLKVADFGLARRFGSNGRYQPNRQNGSFSTSKQNTTETSSRKAAPTILLTPKVVSLWYRPPEILLGADFYDTSVDTWGAGCVIAEMILGTPLLRGRNELDQIAKIFELLGPPPNAATWPELYDFPLVKDGSIEIPIQSQLPYSSTNRISLIEKIGHLPIDAVRLLINLLQYDGALRWSADDALTSTYFREMPSPSRQDQMPTFPSKHSQSGLLKK